MNYRMIARVLGWILLIYAALMLLPLAAGLWYRESVLNFLVTIGLTAALGGLLLIPKPASNSLVARSPSPCWAPCPSCSPAASPAMWTPCSRPLPALPPPAPPW